jgi:prolyl 4-hydroxylase
MNLLTAHWERNKKDKKIEVWPAGNIYTNHWAAPTYMVGVEDSGLRGGGAGLKQQIWDAAKSTIEQWTGMEQKPTSLYGIRMYTDGAILAPHVDRLPLVSSCIVNVAQDVDEDWVLEVYDRQGNAVNVTMEPGDMVLYESGSLIHGRPFPLKGRFFANIFIHFEPTGRTLGDQTLDYLNTLPEFLPPYILPDSPEVESWTSKNPHGWNKPSPSAPIQQMNSPEGHFAAATGDVARLARLAKENKSALHSKDQNGWQPLHEAVRAGSKEAVELLIKHGADMNARTGPDGKGASPLNLALDYRNVGDAVTAYLMSIGAEDIEPDL